jgi:pimeloyl-ACP methyl ester carboxylesterase
MPYTSEVYYCSHQGSDPENVNVILIHGAGGNHLSWPTELRRLSGTNVYALDLPGHGKSEGRGYQTISQYAKSVMNWMDQISLQKAIIIGHSMGGAIASTIAIAHPQLVSGLCLIGSSLTLRVSSEIIEALSQRNTLSKAISMIIKWSFSDQSSEELKMLVMKRMMNERMSVLQGDFIACNGFDIIEDANSIVCPTLVLCGANDRMTPPRQSQLLATKIPISSLKTIPESGHMVMMEKPNEVAGFILEFILMTQF